MKPINAIFHVLTTYYRSFKLHGYKTEFDSEHITQQNQLKKSFTVVCTRQLHYAWVQFYIILCAYTDLIINDRYIH